MAISVKRLSYISNSNIISHFSPVKPFVERLRALCICFGAIRYHCSMPSAYGVGTNCQDFSKCRNGGGIFHKSAHIDETSLIEIGAIVHSKAVLGANVHVGSGAVIGPAVSVGQSTKIGYNVSLSNCTIGESCVIHNGVCIGQDGFGFFVDDQGNMVKKPQLLNARIGNHVEIGANACIDRGSWRETAIGDYSKIDNLVQIGHNVVIGKSCLLCGQVGIAGSATIGDYVTFGGRVAVRDHVSISSKVRLAANSCVTRDIREPGDYGGFPAVPIQEWRRQVANQCRISKKIIGQDNILVSSQTCRITADMNIVIDLVADSFEKN